MYKSVADFYKGQSVFITGGTGFLGKVLMEKLLYSCPRLDKIYVLVREKQHTPVRLRIQKVLEQPLFSRLRHERYEAFKKIIPIAGDISEPNLGMKDEDKQVLSNNVSIVFHAAATVKFNEPLDVAMNMNVAGTERVLHLSQSMKNLKSFVHISTAYSHVDKNVIEEIVYPAPVSINEINKILKIGITEHQEKKLLNKYKKPNTYIFTKALAENLVAENHKNIPSIIIRPSIVLASKGEPIVGWIDNRYGAIELVDMIGRGLNRVLFANPNNIVDLIPVDYVTNLTIVAASKHESSKDVAVYNCSTSGENPVTTENFLKLVIDDSLKCKSYDIPMPSIIFTKSKLIVSLLTLLLQKIPAYIADIFLLATKRQTRFIKIQKKVVYIRDTLEHFASNSWIIRAPKTRTLAQSLSPSDKRDFSCDPADLKWHEYVPIHCQGIRQFLHKKL